MHMLTRAGWNSSPSHTPGLLSSGPLTLTLPDFCLSPGISTSHLCLGGAKMDEAEKYQQRLQAIAETANTAEAAE
ncbi:hypothetical protein NHX12_017955, partial [Muraenolepis orangiensis]